MVEMMAGWSVETRAERMVGRMVEMMVVMMVADSADAWAGQ